ncbi:MAG: hypothetical protein ACD_3C00223G0003 [uncultured bacterium (gcode 4)]|uniref:TraC-like domain-containing protein n=1 Tax=uncultured bacterium (gcode 4) TaxID=1234023 RepID=K2F823_9BACT|nr:MAG: hypothetical protein ACD_3C00223G0003 [uncultured bacterium (gcode 4)]
MTDKTVDSVKSKQKAPSDTTTQRYLPFSEIRDNMIIMKDGSTRMVIKVKAINFNLKSEEEQDSIIYSYQRFLNSLRFPIQIIVRSLKVDIDAYINKLKNLAVKQQNPLLQEQAYRYIDFLVNLIDMAQIMKKDFYIVVPYDSDENKSVRKTWIVWIFQNFWAAITQEENVWTIRERRRKIDFLKKETHERVMTIKTSLEQIWIKSEEVQKDDLIKLMMNYYNPRVNTEIKVREDIWKINVE